MEVLCRLNDEKVLGLSGLSSTPPRRTARAILKDENGRYAVMYSKRFDLYTLPGGGIEDGEAVLTALSRELWEETGCRIEQVEELGIIEENRACQDYTQESHYFVVTTLHPSAQPQLTEDEARNATEVQWHSFATLVSLIRERACSTVQQKYLQARDLAALRAYIGKIVHIRNAVPDDYLAAEQLVQQVQALHISWRPDIYQLCEQVLSRDEFQSLIKNGPALVAEVSGQAAGLLLFQHRHIDSKTQTTRNVIFIDTMVIDEAFRSMGLGHRLFDHIRQLAVEQRLDGIELQVNARNEQALNMYQSYGFRPKSINMELI